MARRALAAWRGGSTLDLDSEDVARLAIERGLVDAYRQVFAVLFWFVVLPGPAGAVLYRAAVLLAEQWRGRSRASSQRRSCSRASDSDARHALPCVARLDSRCA